VIGFVNNGVKGEGVKVRYVEDDQEEIFNVCEFIDTVINRE
jgi:hypothetical protein